MTKVITFEFVCPDGISRGTEFLDAETKRQKSLLKCANAYRDQNPGTDWPEIPAETPYLASYRKRAVCGDWMVETEGTELPTPNQSSNLSLTPELGTAIFDAETGWERLHWRRL